jgi:hypothetical protein
MGRRWEQQYGGDNPLKLDRAEGMRKTLPGLVLGIGGGALCERALTGEPACGVGG